MNGQQSPFTWTSVGALPVILTFVAGCGDPDRREDTVDLCTDREDNDGDRYVDCADPDCQVLAICDGGGDADTDSDSDTDVDTDSDTDVDTDTDGDTDSDSDTETVDEETCDGIDDDLDGTVDDGAPCPCALDHDQGHAYLTCAVGAAWVDAEAECQAWGYHLVTIDDEDEAPWVASIIDAHIVDPGDVPTWIGLNDRDVEGTFEWTSGAPFVYSQWSEGEPNNQGGEDCAQHFFLDADRETPFWSDTGCGFAFPYVCEAGN